METKKSYVPNTFSIGRSVRKEIIRRPDGTLEKKQVVRDSEGNEETVISKEIGDKTYVITTRKDKNGVEIKSEDLINMDESKYIRDVLNLMVVNKNMYNFIQNNYDK